MRFELVKYLIIVFIKKSKLHLFILFKKNIKSNEPT
jgi:hypothetical protein